MTLTSVIQKSGRALLLAAVLGGSAIAAAPAQAASPDVSFSFSFGNGGAQFGRSCLSDREVRRSLRQRGLENIRFIDRRGRVVTVRAEQGRRDVRVTVDSCNGRVLDIDQIGRGRGRR